MFLPAITICAVLLSAQLPVKGTFAPTINAHGVSTVIGESWDYHLHRKQQCPKPKASMSSDSQPKYEAGTHSIAYVTTPNANSAKELARKLVERKLAACVNIIPGLTSIYEWEGKINEDQEILLMIKTRTTRIDELSKFVRENHPYSVAEVISVPIENGNPPYLDWLSKTVVAVEK
ncbi:divalent-cation tolerance protein CutA-like isoform X1 [Armigeres subalbatus]|uniref:divalent-cation tolerance protein CutA-like isoform X1 n=1 Tax=Armigeres subalbatus TaxID=124917 RepID=UPI002ED1FED2